jgi:hypothetical protein
MDDEWEESMLEEDQTTITNGRSELGLGIAVCLVEFLVDRSIVGIVSGAQRSIRVGGSYVLKSKSYIEVGVESFPLASNIPMVCVPVGWKLAQTLSANESGKRKAEYLF